MTVFALPDGRLDGSVFAGATGGVSFRLVLTLEADGPAVFDDGGGSWNGASTGGMLLSCPRALDRVMRRCGLGADGADSL
jgi:hypothetical protein